MPLLCVNADEVADPRTGIFCQFGRRRINRDLEEFRVLGDAEIVSRQRRPLKIIRWRGGGRVAGASADGHQACADSQKGAVLFRGDGHCAIPYSSMKPTGALYSLASTGAPSRP